MSFKEMEDKMQDQQNAGKLSAREIVEAQLSVEMTFNELVADMNPQKLEEFYHDILRKMELFRVKALRFRQLKTDHEIKELSRVPEEEREEYKRQLKERATQTTVATVRRSKTEKMIESFAKKLMESNPALSMEEATERARKLYA
jgi:predicted RecB family endonuclease